MATVSEEFLKRNWRQGAVLPAALVGQLPSKSLEGARQQIGEQDLVLLVSHSCDINYLGPLDKEPLSEAIVARRITKIQSQKRYGKSTRYFQFQHSDGHNYEIWSAERFFIPREILTTHDPGGHLSGDNRRRLTYWIANRYGRAEFPNAFERRLDPKRTEIDTCLRDKGEFLTDIYFNVVDDELDGGVPYNIFGRALMDDGDYQNPDRRKLSVDAVDDLIKIFEGVGIIFAEPFTVESDEEVSIASIRRLKQWNNDVISFDLGDEDRTTRDPASN